MFSIFFGSRAVTIGEKVTMSLIGGIALVTGASRGIGRAIAFALAEAGVDVAVNYRTRKEEAMAVSGEIKSLGRRAIAVQADVSSARDVSRMIDMLEREFGPISILVNNAGISRPQAIQDITEQDWDEVLDINLKSMFLVTNSVLKGMRARRHGRIINLSSVAAQWGGVIGPHYSASKAGVLGLTRSYAALLANEGITVNAIAPALIETDMIRSIPQIRPEIIPVRRFGIVEEVAQVAVMLANNAYITGQTVNVNGGCYMN